MVAKKEYDILENYYKTVSDPAEKQWALRSLGSTRDPELINRLLYWIKDSEEVRNQDKVFPFRTAAQSNAGREIAWNFLQKNIR